MWEKNPADHSEMQLYLEYLGSIGCQNDSLNLDHCIGKELFWKEINDLKVQSSKTQETSTSSKQIGGFFMEHVYFWIALRQCHKEL